jgi:hypothetical protein
LAGDDVLTFGVSSASVSSPAPQAAAAGDGFVQSGLAAVSCSGEAADSSTGLGPGNVGAPGLLEVNLGIPTAECATTTAGGTPTASGSGALAEVGAVVGPTDVLQASLDVSIMKSTSVASGTLAGTAHSEGAASQVDVALSLNADALADTLQTPVCNGLASVPALGQTLLPLCNDLFETVRGNTSLLTLSVLPAEATCDFDGQNATADASAAIVRLSLLGQAPIEVAVNQGIVLLDGTPLRIEIQAGQESVSENGQQASAAARGAFISLLDHTIDLSLSDASCGAAGSISIVPRGGPPQPPLAVTGGPVLPLLAGGSALAAGALGIRRFLKK